MAYIVAIIAKVLAITDGVLEIFTTTPALVGNGTCATGGINVTLSTCGDTLVANLGAVIGTGAQFLANILQAFGAGKF